MTWVRDIAALTEPTVESAHAMVSPYLRRHISEALGSAPGSQLNAHPSADQVEWVGSSAGSHARRGSHDEAAQDVLRRVNALL